MVLLLFGPPGSGKGTQSKRIVDWLGIPAISTGELFRAEAAAGTPLGREAQAIMAQGGLVGDEIVNRMLERRVAMEDTRGGFLLDGYPRTLAQANFLDHLLDFKSLRAPTVLHLEVPDEILIARVSGRRTCPLCNSVYNIFFQPPLQPGRCDRDGFALETRADDCEEVVRARLEAYRAKTGPVLEHYRHGDCLWIDGNRETGRVAADIESQLEARLIRVGVRRRR